MAWVVEYVGEKPRYDDGRLVWWTRDQGAKYGVPGHRQKRVYRGDSGEWERYEGDERFRVYAEDDDATPTTTNEPEPVEQEEVESGAVCGRPLSSGGSCTRAVSRPGDACWQHED